MDATALRLSVVLGLATLLILLPLAAWLARALAFSTFRGKGLVEALVALPLVLPPTVIGFYLLVAFGARSPLGQAFVRLTGETLAFSFAGLLCASVLVNLPFAVQPMQRAFEAIPANVREAAACCGLSRWRTFTAVDLPLAWPGIVSAAVLTFAHTLGEFGVVLMVGGNIPGETRTVSVSVYDSVQAFDYATAGRTSLALLVFSLLVLTAVYSLQRRTGTGWPRLSPADVGEGRSDAGR